MPPVAVTGVKGAVGLQPLLSPHANSATATVVASAGSCTTSVKGFSEVRPSASVTRMVSAVVPLVVPVPLIAPVVALTVNPLGNAPLMTLYTYGCLPVAPGFSSVAVHATARVHEIVDAATNDV